MLTPDQLLQKTAHRFPEFHNATIQPIYEGGSFTRQFHRVQNAQNKSLIVIHYNVEKAENLYYAEHALFLKKQSIHVPEMLGHEEQEKLLWLEDLGEMSLWSQHLKPWSIRSPLYQAALTEVAHLHRVSFSEIASSKITLQQPFDKELYLWEQNYFFEHALGELFGIDKTVIHQLSSSQPVQQLAATLAALPRQLIHRDFQSQNIIFLKDQPYLIDFQGMRAGLAPYDLASLLYDPYVVLTNAEREELLAFYQQEMKQHGVLFPFDFNKVFFQCATQRLMQALGCYGFLGLHHGKKNYLDYVAPALKNLRDVLSKLSPEDRMEELEKMVASIPLGNIVY